MTIIYESGRNFTLKTRNTNVKIGDKVVLGDLEINEPGEYEVGGVQLEIIDGVIQIFSEGIVVGHIKNAKSLTDEELEKLNGINILLVGTGGGEFSDNKAAHEVIGQIDPQIVIPMYETNLDDFVKSDGASATTQDELKVIKSDLSNEDRQVIILNARR